MGVRHQVLHFVKASRTQVPVYGSNGGYKEQDRQQMALEACLLLRELFLVEGDVVAMQLPPLLSRHRHRFERLI